ncbi:prolipoprotein diacylglyceryl transferase [Parvibacter caecicola]|uniref:Uncharacterized protein n=1 Tax=Parvibacter caecicola TaxID=747645 RepID=A0A7W5GR44_9ACTN|nr:hypothetical protein [Parvibacter caecicola]MBB3171903.1 hypothetical protein [Parvibacter caecicola]MCR2040973.1 hypothetical protein [Parvibacter caecicola]
MAPTRRKKPKREPQRPSVAKRGRAAAPAAEPTAAAQGAADEQVATGARQSAGARGAGVVRRAAAGVGPASGTHTPADAAAYEDFSAVDLAEGALYSGSPLSAEDFSQQEDRLDEGDSPRLAAARKRRAAGAAAGAQAPDGAGAADELPGAGRGAEGRSGEGSRRARAADSLLPQNAVSAVMGAGVVVESLARHGGDAAADSPSALADDGADAVEESSLETVSSAAGQDVSRGGEKASAIADGEEASGKGSGRGRRAANASGAAGSAPEGEGEAAAYGDTPAAAGPAEVSDEERAVFYSAVPKQREQEAEGKGRPKRKGKVAVAKGKVAGNLRIAGAVNAAGQKAKDAAQAARGRKVSVGLVVKIALAAVLVAVVAVGVSSMIAFNHVRDSGNDAQDIQGTWYLNGTNVAVQITPDEIVLTGDVAYDYQLDATNKTIQLEFGNLKGGGSYLFSLNRQQLMIVDGQDHATETLLEDFWWTIQALLAQARGEEYPLPTMENATYLNRAPAPGGAMTDATADASGKGLLSSGADGDAAGSGDADGSGDAADNGDAQNADENG